MPEALDPALDPALVGALDAEGFDVIEALGSGATSIVLAAMERSSGDRVAVKCVRPGSNLDRALRETDLLALVNHPGIPRLRGHRIVDGAMYLITDWVEGRPAAHLVRSGPLAPRRALEIFEALAEILDHVHAGGVVHRDVSGANVLVTDGAGPSSVALVDFGLGTVDDDITLTAEGITAGTPRYLAPEVLAGENASPASDQYAAAVLLYELLTGRDPYREDRPSNVSVTVADHLHREPVPPSEIDPLLPAGLDDPVLRGLAKNPADRHASMGEFTEAVKTGLTSARSSTDGNRNRPLRAAAVGLTIGLLAGGAVVAVAGGDRNAEGGADDQAAGPELSLDVPGILATEAWPEGTASELECNQWPDPGFDVVDVPRGFYPGDADKNELRVTSGLGGGTALGLGVTSTYGLYGHPIEVTPGESYLFSTWVSPIGEIVDAAIRLTWLDADFQPVGSEPSFAIDPTTAGRLTLISGPAPAEASVAVPTIAKEASSGALVLDEMVFTSSGAPCADRVTGR